MMKSATLIVSALMTFGLAAASVAADMPKTAPALSADSAASASGTTKTHKHKAKHKKSTPAPSTTK